jgi:hypothetical protein
MSPFRFPFRPLFDVLVVFVPILTFYFLSRRFEYAADAAGPACRFGSYLSPCAIDRHKVSVPASTSCQSRVT